MAQFALLREAGNDGRHICFDFGERQRWGKSACRAVTDFAVDMDGAWAYAHA